VNARWKKAGGWDLWSEINKEAMAHKGLQRQRKRRGVYKLRCPVRQRTKAIYLTPFAYNYVNYIFFQIDVIYVLRSK
jgi:hypothetical protein